MKRDDKVYLKHILESIADIEESIKSIDKKKFVSHKDTKDANIRRVEVIGEAIKNLSTELKSKYSSVPWKDIVGARDRMIHQYFGVNLDIVWDILKHDMPVLKKEISKIKKDLEE